jgi:hypothetical protein
VTDVDYENLASGKRKDYAELLSRYSTEIVKVAKEFKKRYNVKMPLSELEQYAQEGFFYACRSYIFKTPFQKYVKFYTEQYLFYQTFVEEFLIHLSAEDRSCLEDLYTVVLKYLDPNTGANYYDAIINAACEIDMPLDYAFELMSRLMCLNPDEKIDELKFEEDTTTMSKWCCNCNEDVDISTAPLAFMLVLLEKQMGKRNSNMPFKSICEMFEKVALVPVGG